MTGAEKVDPATGRAALGQQYLHHYSSLVRLAAFLSRDSGAAEDTAQEAYVRASLRVRGYSLNDDGLSYLRTCIVNLCHSEWRHGQVVRRALPRLSVELRRTSAEEEILFDRQAIVQALRQLPPRQREVVVLRHYVGLSERETAETLGISLGAVKSQASRGLATLRIWMEQNDVQ